MGEETLEGFVGRNLPEGAQRKYNLSGVEISIFFLWNIMLAGDKQIFIGPDVFRFIVGKLLFLVIFVFLIIEFPHVLIVIPALGEKEVYYMAVACRHDGVSVFIFYAEFLQDHGDHDLAFGVPARAVQMGVFLDFAHAGGLGLSIARSEISYILALGEGQGFILGLEVPKALLQLFFPGDGRSFGCDILLFDINLFSSLTGGVLAVPIVSSVLFVAFVGKAVVRACGESSLDTEDLGSKICCIDLLLGHGATPFVFPIIAQEIRTVKREYKGTDLAKKRNPEGFP